MRHEILRLERRRFWRDEDKLEIVASVDPLHRRVDDPGTDSRPIARDLPSASRRPSCPFALVSDARRPPDQIWAWSRETSALTYGHITDQLAASARAEMLADVAAGEFLDATARRIVKEYALLEGGEETSRAIHAALAAPRDGRPETVESLGGGRTAEEAQSIALYACLASEDLADSLRIAVTHAAVSIQPAVQLADGAHRAIPRRA